MSSPKLLIFDLDGTLIDSHRDLVACVNATLRHRHLPTLEDRQIVGFIGDGAAALVQRSLQAAAGDPAYRDNTALPFFLDYYREHLLDHTAVYPGVMAALNQVQALPSPPRMAVLTNKPVNPSRRICDALGLTPFLFANYGGNSFPTKKPHPEGLIAIWREAETLYKETLHPDQVVMIGDSEVDVQTARNAGVAAWGCLWGFATARMLQESPNAIAREPADWVSLAHSTRHVATASASR